MKTCEEYQELVSAYVDGEAADDETAEVFFHLGSCRECRQFMTSVLQVQSLLQVNEPAAPDASQHTTPSVWKRTLRLPYPLAAAAAVVMFITGSLVFVQRTQRPEVINKTQMEFVYVSSLPPVDVVASPLPPKKSN